MRAGRVGIGLAALAATLAWLTGAARPVRADEFTDQLARVTKALETNPNRVGAHALDSCQRQRDFALQLYESNHRARAQRSLDYCFDVLGISKEAPVARKVVKTSIDDVQARAARELEQAQALVPDVLHGLQVYRGCAECHGPEGWGLESGMVPQLAGQHRGVVIKQLADIRAGNRQNVVMAPYATVEVIGGPQAVADVAAYIDTLEISVDGGKGPGDQLELGERLYRDNCARCHGPSGEGDPKALVPRIQAQHFGYLVRQFEDIQSGRRHNANAEMREQIASFQESETKAVLDYVSRLEPPPELQAPPGWSNPDFR